MTNGTPIEYWRRWKENGDKAAFEKLMTLYADLVPIIVKKYFYRYQNHPEFDDLISEGYLGLHDAMKKFDYTRGLQFETYASHRIRGAIIDYIRKIDPLPRVLREKARMIEKAYRELEQSLLRSVTDEEIAEHLGIPVGEFHQILLDTSFVAYFSLDESVDGDTDKEVRSDYIGEPNEAIDDLLLQQALEKAIERLPEREKVVISLLYLEDISLTEVARIMKLSPSRISQLHAKALYRLRNALNQQRESLFAK
jgi:RNA polymerase sigma factor for flagellar operon FliA